MYLTLFPTKVNILVYLGTSHRVATPTPPPPSILCCPDQSRPSTPGPFTHLTFPRPHLTPTSPLYLTQRTPPTLTHWWFSMWRTQLPQSPERALPFMYQTINLHLPTLYTFCTYLTSKPDMRTHGIVRLFQHCFVIHYFNTPKCFYFPWPKPDY